MLSVGEIEGKGIRVFIKENRFYNNNREHKGDDHEQLKTHVDGYDR